MWNKRTGYRNNSFTLSFLASFWVPLIMPMLTSGSCCHCLEIFAHYLFFKSRTFFSFKNKWLFLQFNSQISRVSRNREEALCCASRALKWRLLFNGQYNFTFSCLLILSKRLFSINHSYSQTNLNWKGLSQVRAGSVPLGSSLFCSLLRRLQTRLCFRLLAVCLCSGFALKNRSTAEE